MGVIRAVPTELRRLALTFDDGPSDPYTASILDTLQREGVKATFFVSGCAVTSDTTELVKRAAREGHEIANHTHSHVRLSECEDETVRQEISRTHFDLEELTGGSPSLIRPPYGDALERVDAVATQLHGYRATVHWSIDVDDWTNPQPAAKTIVDRVLSHEKLGPGAIVLFHDGCADAAAPQSRAETCRALELLLPELRDLGLEPVTVSELLEG
jgi:peptidoglycan/xylan/chitin deacetylase (PgdA/CDA1 family)